MSKTSTDGKVAVRDGESLLLLLDLADFPHGKLSEVRKDDLYDIEFYEVPASLQVPSYAPETGRVEWKHVKYWSVHRGKELEIVNLAGGTQIYTDHDPRAVYGVACDAATVEPARFTPSDALARRVLVPMTTETFSDCHANAWYDFETGRISSTSEGSAVRIDFDFGQFVGIMAGDGWASYSEVLLSDNEGFNYGFVESFLKNAYPEFYSKKYVFKKEDLPGRYGDTVKYRLNIGHTYFYDRIKELVDGHGDETTSGSANKRLPEWYQFAGKDFIRGLVCGLLATDGTVAVSASKRKPQLRIQYTSTSLRLAREFQRCCRILGVGCTVSYSKDTSGGNRAWNCTVSTVDAKKANLLGGCCHARKLKVFQETEVLLGDRYVKNDVLPFPKNVSDEIVRLVPAVKNPQTEEAREQWSLCVGVRKYAEQGSAPRAIFERLTELGGRLAKANIAACDKADEILKPISELLDHKFGELDGRSAKNLSAGVSRAEEAILRSAVEARKSNVRDNAEAGAMLKMLYLVRKHGRIGYAQLQALKKFFDDVPPDADLLCSEALGVMRRLAASEVEWRMVESVERTGVEMLGYDLTVPGYDTFVNADGLVLSNTVNLHVPASEKASKEALEKMLPSKNLLSLTDMQSVRYKPEKEQVSGLWALTNGTTGVKPRIFATKEEAVRAYRDGEIGPNDPVVIKGE